MIFSIEVVVYLSFLYHFGCTLPSRACSLAASDRAVRPDVALVQCIRQNEWETKEFGKVRKLLNEAVSLVTPYYDIARINADESDDEEAEAPEATYDYLSPFLPNISGTRGLTRNEALHVREVCLRALKERLIERANIIQACPRHVV